MSVDVDAVNERLNGLVTLLKAVGVDALDKGGDMSSSNKNFNKNGDLSGGMQDVARQLNDDQIEAIIKKLQLAQAEAPQIIAALEAHAEARSLNGGRSRDATHQQLQSQQHYVQQQEQEEEEEDDDDDDDDEYDEDANYPMVGHGCSDDISVVSDLTTPTVCTGVSVPDEEHYRETLPPMIVGGGLHDSLPPMMIAPPKRKNLVQPAVAGGAGGQRHPGVVGGVGAQGIAPPQRRVTQSGVTRAGGAAAARRKNYQETMAKLHENPHGMAYVGPPAVSPAAAASPSTPAMIAPLSPQPATPAKKKSSSNRSTGGSTPSATPAAAGPTKKRSVKPRAADGSGAAPVTPDRAGGNDWGFGTTPSPHGKKAGPPAPTVIDDDGFLVGESFDPFAVGNNNPFKSHSRVEPDPFSSNASANFDAFGNAANPRKNASSRQQSANKKMSSSRSNDSGSHDGDAAAPAQRQRKQRQASVTGASTGVARTSSGTASREAAAASGAVSPGAMAPPAGVRRNRRASSNY